MGLSVIDRLAMLPADDRERYVAELPEEVLEQLAVGAWAVRARPEQLPPPGEWFIWFVRAGRGLGKTELAAE